MEITWTYCVLQETELARRSGAVAFLRYCQLDQHSVAAEQKLHHHQRPCRQPHRDPLLLFVVEKLVTAGLDHSRVDARIYLEASLQIFFPVLDSLWLLFVPESLLQNLFLRVGFWK